MTEKQLKKALNGIEISQEIQNRILLKSRQTNKEKENYFMKSKRKISILAAAATLILGIAAFAANSIVTSWHSSSYNTPEYTSLPTEEQCIKDVGYSPVLIGVFDNGYAFENGSVVKNDLQNNGNQSVEKFKSLTFRYTKNGNTVTFSQEKFNSEIEMAGTIVAAKDGINIYYYRCINKFVPVDYTQTEEDKKAEANGELVFSYGTNEVTISQIQSVTWVTGGIHYQLMQIDGDLSLDDLVSMAYETIGSK